MANPQLRSEPLESAQLQLLDGSFAFAKPLGDFPDASLVHEALVNDAPLNLRKLAYQPEQPGTVFDGAYIEMRARIGGLVGHGMFARRSLRVIDDRIGSASQEPRPEGHSAPFVVLQIGERFVEHFRRQIFRGGAVAHATSDKAVYPLEV